MLLTAGLVVVVVVVVCSVLVSITFMEDSKVSTLKASSLNVLLIMSMKATKKLQMNMDMEMFIMKYLINSSFGTFEFQRLNVLRLHMFLL